MSYKPISILISAWHTAQFITPCLDSIYSSLQSARRPWKLLIGIDGCRDTLDRVMLYPFGSNASVHWFPDNVGMYRVSNTLLNYSKPGYVLQFGSDDLMLASFARFLDEVNPGVITQAIYRDFYDNPQNAGNIGCKPKLKLACGVVVIPTDVFDVLGGWRPWRCAADRDLIARAQLAKIPIVGTLKSGVEQVFMRRRHRGSLTSSPETSGHSQLRRQYHELIDKNKDVYVTPQSAKCIQVL